jgi:hypothetical protein
MNILSESENTYNILFDISVQVLEVLLTTCNSVIHKFKEEREARLQGLERIAKATILGHLLPVLLTALNHVNLHWLPLADELMPKLVHLVVLSSQVQRNIILIFFSLQM